jgi:SAM-dependent methyltransferase
MYLVHAGRLNLLKLLPSMSVTRIAEVGVFNGDLSKKILEFLEPEELVLVDKWEMAQATRAELFRDGIIPLHMANVLDTYSSYFDGNADDALQKAYDVVFGLAKDNSAIRILRKDSILAARDFEDGYFDIIYIDAFHFYESALGDLFEWHRKLKHGGIIICNDFYESSIGARQNLGVIAAVSTFLKRTGASAIAVSAMPFSDIYLTNNTQSDLVKIFINSIICSDYSKLKISPDNILAFHHELHQIDGKTIKIPSITLT